MDHISANLAFGEREKIFGGIKSSRGAANNWRNWASSTEIYSLNRR